MPERTLVMGGWEDFASRLNWGKRATSAAFSNKINVGSWSMPPANT